MPKKELNKNLEKVDGGTVTARAVSEYCCVCNHTFDHIHFIDGKCFCDKCYEKYLQIKGLPHHYHKV